MAQKMGPGHTIVTILCDSGMRHLSKFYNAEYLAHYGLTPSASGLEFLGISSGENFQFIIHCIFFIASKLVTYELVISRNAALVYGEF